MTKSEEKLLELVLEKVESLEARLEEVKEDVDEAKKSAGGNVTHNHYHSHYYERAPRPTYPQYPYWTNGPYYSTWCSSDSSSLPKSGTFSVGAGSKAISATSGGYSSGLARNTTDSVSLNKLEDAGMFQVLARVGN